ncbi:MAG: hypothetical protein FWJ90_11570, partial [Actinomadura sp.]
RAPPHDPSPTSAAAGTRTGPPRNGPPPGRGHPERAGERERLPAAQWGGPAAGGAIVPLTLAPA